MFDCIIAYCHPVKCEVNVSARANRLGLACIQYVLVLVYVSGQQSRYCLRWICSTGHAQACTWACRPVSFPCNTFRDNLARLGNAAVMVRLGQPVWYTSHSVSQMCSCTGGQGVVSSGTVLPPQQLLTASHWTTSHLGCLGYHQTKAHASNSKKPTRIH